MTSQHDKAKRWRPRFSVRTLVILVTLFTLTGGALGHSIRREFEMWQLHRDYEAFIARHPQETYEELDAPKWLMERVRELNLAAQVDEE